MCGGGVGRGDAVGRGDGGGGTGVMLGAGVGRGVTLGRGRGVGLIRPAFGFTTTQADNSDVLPVGSVAVAVIT